MSWKQSRARRRRARIEQQIETLLRKAKNATTYEEQFTANDELVELMMRVADSDLQLWTFKDQLIGPEKQRGTGCCEDVESMRALIAQLVNQKLAGSSPRRVRDDHPSGE